MTTNTPPLAPPNLPDGDPDRALTTRMHRRILSTALAMPQYTAGAVAAPYVADLAAGGYVTTLARWEYVADQARHVMAIDVTPTEGARTLPRYAVIVVDLNTGHPVQYGDVELGDEGYTAARAVVDGLPADAVWSTVVSLHPADAG